MEGWYVPEIRGYAKTIVNQSSGRDETIVLTDYQKSDDPSDELPPKFRLPGVEVKLN